MSSKRDRFNEFAAYALSALDDEHPYPVNLVPSKIVEALGYESTKHNIFLCQQTLSWLDDNGYFRCGSRSWSGNPAIAETAFREARLTTLGFSALDIRVEFRGKLERAGDILAGQISSVAGKTRDAVISDIVGRIVGMAAKGLLGV